jgi:transcription-repair coupling factor (superfamily II helicase)
MSDAPIKQETISQPLPFIGAVRNAKVVTEFLQRAHDSKDNLSLQGMAGALKGLVPALLHKQEQRQIVIICNDTASALDAWNDASLLLGEDRTVFIGERSTNSQLTKTIDNTFAENADLLRSLTEDPKRLIVTDVDSLAMEYPSTESIKENSLHIERFMTMKQDELLKRLAFGGFERNEFVSVNGEFAVRGGIIDVFPIGFDNPIRIEFFGDEIDSIREFDALSQRSIRQADSISFVTSLFYDDDGSSHTSTMFDYFLDSSILFIEELSLLTRVADEKNFREIVEERLAAFQCCYMSIIVDQQFEMFDFGARSQPSFNSSIKLLHEYIQEQEEHETSLFLLADSEQQVKRLDDLINESFGEDDAVMTNRYPIHYCPLSKGFELPDAQVSVLTEHQIFNRQRIRRNKHKGKKGLSLRDLQQLHIGDYVVHVDKGIGKFAGFHTITVNGGIQETAKIFYADNDVLYVNLNYINRLQKYASEEAQQPKLSKLGSGEWERAKAKTKSRLKDIARDLIKLYAKRKMSQGFAFSEDSAWQKEMEASFIYEDTPDQYKATVDVKRDMEDRMPMDRLVCGDVGYGKTEVAMRAAFKSVLDGKQVAVLVPTTILAQQHFHTFRDRLNKYSVRVESISRFRTKAEQDAIVEGLKKGSVDILIGTHRLLSKDIGFKNLGLLIVDEEHRFGVAAKEKLRQLRANVDTLTLTATPIPRTLNFSLLGARDLSIIETPPKNRLPIITSILSFEKEVILEGVMRELDRGGQVFVVNDKVKDIEYLADLLRNILPGVRIGVAHGQMKSSELERIMLRFLEKKLDILVATKIVESGLDIPNANTIFINNADRFGLAELYQLRGRVGRSNTQAYSYLLIPKDRKLTRDALKRLQAIEEFSELGTGFHLAMRDMEIRGAGNMLGGEQSGFIYEIGFDLYMMTLEDAVKELKESEFKELFEDEMAEKEVLPRSDVVMELGLDSYLPQDYVRNSTERFDLYKRLYNAHSESDIKQIEEEIFDRFGLYPSETENLLYIVRLRLIAATIRLSRVTWDKNVLVLALPPEDDEEFYTKNFQAVVNWIMANKDSMNMKQDKNSVRIVVSNIKDLKAVEAVLNELLSLVSEASVVTESSEAEV